MEINNLTQLKDEGYCILKNVFSPEIIKDWKDRLVEHMSHKENRCAHEGGATLKPDAINDPSYHHQLLIFKTPEIIEFLREACGGELKYAHHYDNHLNVPALGMHHDGGIRHLGGGNYSSFIKKIQSIVPDLTLQELFGTDDYGSIKRASNNYNNKHLVRGEEHLVYRVGIYMQDCTKRGGLSVLPKSHKQHSSDCVKKYLPTEIGDVIIFDCRTFHEGNIHPDKNRGAIFTAFCKPNFLSDLYIMGTIERQLKQNQETTYTLHPELEKTLKESNILY